MRRFTLVVVAGLAVLLLAVPAAAQDADPYGEVLPDDIEAPGEITSPPDTTPADTRAAGSVGARQAPGTVVRAAAGSLPRTGFGVTVGMLFLGIALFAAGTAAVLTARRRSRATS